MTTTTLDAINSVECPRCSGSGHYSFNYVYGTRCFQCWGRGRLPQTPEGQPDIQPTAPCLKGALPGDVILSDCTLYRVTDIQWGKLHTGKDGKKYNARVYAHRIVDGLEVKSKRLILGLDGEPINPSEDMIGKLVSETGHLFICQKCHKNTMILGTGKIAAYFAMEVARWQRSPEKVDGRFEWTCPDCK